MKIYVCQTTPKVCDLENNFLQMRDLYLKSQNLKADICLFPELALPGYMVRDFFTYHDFVKSVEEYNQKLVEISGTTCLLIPTITSLGDKTLYNSVIAAQNGKIIGVTQKYSLPNYGIFEETRYFKPGTPSIIRINNRNVGIPICADIWTPEVCYELKKQGAEIFLVPNASPFEMNKFNARYAILKDRYNETKIPFIYCNQVIAQDGIIFEGRSVLYDGDIKNIGAAFATSEKMVYFEHGKLSCLSYEMSPINIYQDILDAMIMGVKGYVQDNNFEKVLIGLSGGIDSALVAYIAVKALGSKNVRAYMLPSIYTSQDSLTDAKKLADNLGIYLQNINIDEICRQFINSLGGANQVVEGTITHQNIQSRVRGVILMGESNKHNALLLTTGNKSEYATGYATIYGDMNGAFNPIKDLYKTEIYQLANYINKKSNVIPQRIITKSPSAELKPLQKDLDSLGAYEFLDPILKDYIENKKSLNELKKIYDPILSSDIVNLVNKAEFKRRQSVIGVKLSHNSFDLERRVPITHYFR
ncbi:MAG: NAD+ synthase [Rickettsiaceae bacterium]|nr:NAD+ synthase [Rickettsiaceae bacterium]